MSDKMVQIDCGESIAKLAEKINARYDTITLTRAEFEAVTALLESAIDLIDIEDRPLTSSNAIEQALAILAKHEVKDDNA